MPAPTLAISGGRTEDPVKRIGDDDDASDVSSVVSVMNARSSGESVFVVRCNARVKPLLNVERRAR